MTAAISAYFEFEQLDVMLEGRPAELFGMARILEDRRTWWVDAIDLYVDAFVPPAHSALSQPPGAMRLRPVHLRGGTELFETLRAALHRQCGPAISESMNRAVEEQGGYEILFGEAMPSDRFERGRSRLNAPSRVYELAA